MENATNGLMMAGSVLIGIILLSLFVYMFSSMGNITKEFESTMSEQSIRKFNEPFEKYIGRTDLNTHDLLTILNLKIQRDKDAELSGEIEEGKEIIKLEGIPTNPNNIDLSDNKTRYTCIENSAEYSLETQKLTKLVFKETPK